jgi:hypothetical protein
MTPTTRLIGVVTLVLIGLAQALAPPPAARRGAPPPHEDGLSRRRRDLVAASLVATTTVAAALLLSPGPAAAIQERNEVLCGTGFFTNIWQYKCTDLGDISDEGVRKELSAAETTATDALLSKLMPDSSSSGEQDEGGASGSLENDDSKAKKR